MRPIQLRSQVFEIPLADTVYVVDRVNGTLAVATGDPTQEGTTGGLSYTVPFGAAVQNRTTGDLYMWYGPLPDNTVPDITDFKAMAFILPKNETFMGTEVTDSPLYLAGSVNGNVHHMII